MKNILKFLQIFSILLLGAFGVMVIVNLFISFITWDLSYWKTFGDFESIRVLIAVTFGMSLLFYIDD